MLKLNASYSKKVPAESEYSSQSYHCTIEVELPDGLTGQQLQEKVHDVFAFVRNSVEAELHSASSAPQTAQQPVPQQPVQQPYNAPQQNYPQNQLPYRNAVATPKQVNYLLSLAKRAGWSVQQILQRCQIPNIEAIPSKTCSQLIQEFSKGGVAA
ncbi:MAG: hypothetical protein IJJ33_20135 [Victivallales bacterium]|nr:hypothetical protein [Victivallales bacterium]